MAQRARSNLLGRFFLASLLWLPAAFLVWHYLAAWLSLPVIWLARAALDLLAPGLVQEVIGPPADLHFATSIAIEHPETPPGAVAELVVAVNVLKYCWNLPLLLALLFAADERHFSPYRLVVGYLALLPFQAWGVTFDVLKTVGFEAGPEGVAQLGWSGWEPELVALGYQFGYLMLPVIAATSVWIALNRPLLQALLGDPRPPSRPTRNSSP